jgi:YD repeat-containing protein
LQTETVYAAVAADGSGVADGGQGVTRYVHDRAGLLLSSIGPAGAANSPAPTTLYAYDGLGRLLSTTDALGQTTITRHDDAGNKTVTTLANGLVTTHSYDKAGRLASVLQSSAQGAGLGQTQYFHDAAGRLRMTQDPTGVRMHKFYDEAGRLAADIDGDGSLTAYSYDSNNRLTRTLAYADALSTAALARLVDGNGRPANVTLASLGATRNPAQDLLSWRIHDDAGRLARTVAADGAVVDLQYDGASRLTAEIHRGTRVDVSALGAAPTLAQTEPAAGSDASEPL